jgi:periplasmic divalent cation tolerance protein
VSRAASEDSVVVVWITAPNLEEAKALSDAIIDQQLAACVNIMPGIESVYKWEGKVGGHYVLCS